MNTILKKIGLTASLCLMGLSYASALEQIRLEVEDYDYDATDVSNAELSGGKGLSLLKASDYIKVTFNVTAPGYYKVMVGGSNMYGDGKVIGVAVNGASGTTAINGQEESSAGTFEFRKGESTITITPIWTYAVVDYISLVPDEDAMKPFTFGSPVTPNPTPGAEAIYNLLTTNFGVKTVSGAMLGNMDNTDGKDVLAHEDVAIFKQISGKNPALVGVDFMNATGQSAYSGNSWFESYTTKSLSLMKDLWAKGGIPKFTWHWRDPSLVADEFYFKSDSHPNGTTFDFTKAMNADGTWNTNSDDYKAMIKDIDVIADYFLELKDAGVAGIFRPLHEASGGWFWWGTKGGENYAKLYRLIYDEMVKVKGVNNLLWVWNPNTANDVDWNPGEDYYDIISVDIYHYDNGGNPVYHVYDTQSATFLKLKNLCDSKKLIALTECGSIPDVELCYEEAVPSSWSWWMPWYESWSGNWVSKGTEPEMWTKVMNSEHIITLEDMKGWTSAATDNVESESGADVYPTKVSNYFMVNAENANVVVTDAAGRMVVSKSVKGATSIATTDWNNGVYFVNVSSENGKKTYKLVK